ncbi:unnamed protein product [Cuscuta epithymum]|uniref:Uncharacterized protein n=1 Tax=Cuscuta epithymum TaxID=186058 RepID=A0AAV0E9N8_9ASTE|nr:unnamed protein product [Cuscuta epithymum]CAH9119509.1 unnamed protein product [Cuscuta epithymum]
MAIAFTSLSWWPWSGKHQEPKFTLSPLPESGLWESDKVKFPLDRRQYTSRRVKRKWSSREERKIDKEYDIVLVPSDGGCVSGSESDDSDWSIGWMEPHGSGFQGDDESDDSFAVLVPCYGHAENFANNLQDQFLSTVRNIPDIYATESKTYMEQWLSSLQNV